LMAVSLLTLRPSAQASGNPWYDSFVAYNTANGGNYTASTDAAFLAWQEGLMLRAYLNLFEVSKDPA